MRAASGDHPLPVLGPVGPRFRRRLAVVAALAFALSVITGPATSFVFLYAQNVLHQPGFVTAAMVVGAGAAGLAGLWSAGGRPTTWGRRPTGAVALVGLAGFGTLTYAGSRPALVCGYILGILAGSVLAPSVGALLTELFPTSVRASVAGWWVAAGVVGAVAGLVLFGAVADVGNRFGLAAVGHLRPGRPGRRPVLARPRDPGQGARRRRRGRRPQLAGLSRLFPWSAKGRPGGQGRHEPETGRVRSAVGVVLAEHPSEHVRHLAQGRHAG